MTDVALRFTAVDAGLTAGFAKVSQQLGNLEKQAAQANSSIASTFNGLKAALSGVVLTKLTGELVNYAEEINEASIRTGIAVEEIQRLQFIAGQADVDFDQITSAVNKFQRQLVEGGKDSSEALSQIGTSLTEIKELSPDKQFEAIAEGISQVEDPARRVALSVDLFGKSGAELLPVLLAVGQEAAAMNVRFEELGGAVSGDAIRKVDDLGDSVDGLKTAAKSLGVELLGLTAKPFTILINLAGSGAGALRHLIQDTKVSISGGTDDEEISTLVRQLEHLRKARGDYVKSLDGDSSLGDVLNRDQTLTGSILDRASADSVIGAIEKKLSDLQRAKALADSLKNPFGDDNGLSNVGIPTGIRGLGLNDKERSAAEKAERDEFRRLELDAQEKQRQIELEASRQLQDDQLTDWSILTLTFMACSSVAPIQSGSARWTICLTWNPKSRLASRASRLRPVSPRQRKQLSFTLLHEID